VNPRQILTRVFRNFFFFYSKITRTSRFWDQTDTALSEVYWWNNKVIREFIQKEITGDARVSWYTRQINDHRKPFGRILTFGDGYGMAAEAFLARGDATEIMYLNISKGEGDRFKRKMEALNLGIPCHFIQADANTFNYTSLGGFDTIIDVGAFHHFENFEFIFPLLNDILKPDGVMFVDEFVGPSKWKFDKLVIEIINDLLASLPGELIASSKPVRQRDFFNLVRYGSDPSECIRSGDLRQQLLENFEPIKTIFYGGSLLLPFFLTASLKPNRLKIQNWLHTELGQSESKRLVQLEKTLIGSGRIKPDYIYYVFEKRKIEI